MRAGQRQSLKRKNAAALAILALTDVLAIAIVLGLVDFPQLIDEARWMGVLRHVGAIVGGSMLAVYLSDILPSGWKDALIFWRATHALPGHRAFTEHAKQDSRINPESLKALLGSLPRKPVEQNQAWYALLEKYQDDLRVAEAHQRFLLYRDGVALTLVLGFLGVVSAALLGREFAEIASVALGAAVQFFWLVISGRNAGIALVRNVLAVASNASRAMKGERK